MSKFNLAQKMKTIKEKSGKAAGRIKAAVRDFLVKVNPGP